MRLIDQGKAAATFVDSQANPLRAIRIWPSPAARSRALELSPEISVRSRWHAQLAAYQVMPDTELLAWRDVELTVSLQAIISQAGMRVTCARCSEEIMNERQVVRDGVLLCRHCAGDGYYA